MSERKPPRPQPSLVRESGSARRALDASKSTDQHDPRRLDRFLGYPLEEAAARLFAPSRRAIEELRELAQATDDPLEAYESLIARGFMTDRWLTSQRQVIEGRCAECSQKAPWFIGHESTCPQLLRPQTVRSIAAIASDFAGILAAESLAREAWVRLYPWRWSDEPTIIWQVVDPIVSPPEYLYSRGELMPTRRSITSDAASSIVAQSMARSGAPRPSDLIDWRVESPQWTERFELDASAHWSWALSERKRPNPFTPLCEVWMLGYCVVEMREKTLVLMAPLVR